MEEREQELRRRIELPESYRELAETNFRYERAEPRIYRMYRRNWGLSDPETMTDYMVANALQFELIDEALGRLFSYLDETAGYDDTWICFIADHGEMNGESALIDKGAYLNPQVMRVPIFLKPSRAEGFGGGTTVDTPVSLVDIAPTFLELAGVESPEMCDGVSLLRTMSGEERPEDRPILFEIWSHVMPNPSVGFVFRSESEEELYLFAYNATDEIDELYRLERRRGLTNLFVDSEFSTVVDEAVEKLYAALARDQRFRSYRNFLELEYAGLLSGGGDRQHFV
jgi:arylsulfatase A-like enzyme